MNLVHPKSLLNSKWTKVEVVNKEKHFTVTKLEFDEQQNVIECVLEAVINCAEYSINWRDLKQPQNWKIGWQ
jgi:tryptophan-rich hypothetical protein